MYATQKAYSQVGNAYKTNEIMTASPKKLVIMLYEGAVKFLKLAKLSMADGNIEKTHQSIVKAQNILTELMSTLNFEEGGDIAKNLMALYEYMYQKTIRANVEKNPEHLNEVITFLEDLRDTWNQL